ncbi:MAG: TonB-dependent receptor [Myxococcales bacterium]|nr:TonB-dependent receptor [Myxococcales bacterium]
MAPVEARGQSEDTNTEIASSEEEPELDDERGVDLETIVVTGVGGGRQKTQLNSSVSVSDLSLDEVKDFAPRTTAEIFRNLPGIRSESSGGENNANIQVRGLPVTTGGAKFVQLQEDGLPIFAFGDMTFGNADNFLRFDTTVQRLEAIRGGSASTFASNAPGAIINFISRTGEEEGGEIGLTRGLDFDTTRVDFRYGGAINEDWLVHVGGFYRIGEGTRAAGYIAEEGGQIKANITRKFDRGYIRLHLKHLDDRTIPYLPSPVRVTDSGDIKPLDLFDFRNQSLSSQYLQNNVRVDANGQLHSTSIPDGVRSLSSGVGLELELDLGQDWKLTQRGRYAANSGGFVGTFTSGVYDSAGAIAEYGGSSLVFHNGTRAGLPVSNDTLLGQDILVSNQLFDVRVDDLSHFVNDLRLSKVFETQVGTFDLSIGYYKSVQQVQTEWSFNTYLQEARGKNAGLIDVLDAQGNPLSVNGVVSFGDFDPYFDLSFDRNAVYGSIAYSIKSLTFDASVRYEIMQGSGTSNQGAASPFTALNTDDNDDGVITGDERDIDIDGDGRIVSAEQDLNVVDQSNLFAVDYLLDFVSYSFGANYILTDGLALFMRFSRGAVANGDRLLLAGGLFGADGDLLDDDPGVDVVHQFEGGLKFRSRGDLIPGSLAMFITGFFAESEENNFEATSNQTFDRTVEAGGVELETSYTLGPLFVSGGCTITDAKIASDSVNPDNEGNRPRRQAVFTYQVTGGWYDYIGDRDYSLGLNVVGTSDAYTQDDNTFVMPAYHQFNLFVNVDVVEALTVSFNANNLFDEFGLTEAEPGETIVASNRIIRARPINGRTLSASLRYQF